MKPRFGMLSLALVCSIAASTAPAQEKPDQSPPPPPTRPQQPQQPPARQRPNVADRPPNPNAQQPPRIPDNIQLVRDVVYAEVPGGANGATIELKMDTAFLKQTDGKPMPAVVYIHGGGWEEGGKSMGLPYMVPLALGGYFAASIDYRLVGVAIYPAAVHDCKAAIRFLRANADELGIDPQRIGVWGNSAGAHLSALLGTSAGVKELEGDVGEHDDASSAVQCVVDVSGPADFTRISNPQAESAVTRWLGGSLSDKQREAIAASPVTHIDAGDPPFLVVHGTADRVVPIAQGEFMRDALKAKGVEVEYLPVEGAGHSLLQERRIYRRIGEFLDKHLGGHAADAMTRLARTAGNTDGPPQRNRPPQ